MIEAKNISKYFDGTRILHDVSATFESGKTNLSSVRVDRERLYS